MLTGNKRFRVNKGILGECKLILQVEEEIFYTGAMGMRLKKLEWRDATPEDIMQFKGDLEVMSG